MHAPKKWTADLAYLVGYITTDGNLSSDGRHVTIVSKDREHLEKINRRFHIGVKIGVNYSGYSGIYYPRLAFGGKDFYHWLVSIGLTPNKSKTIGPIKVPKVYFRDFLRGHFDGDGTIYSYFDPRWRSSYMVYLCFMSASKCHVTWLYDQIKFLYKIQPARISSFSSIFYIRFSKYDTLKLISIMYKNSGKQLYLKRKKDKIQKILADVL